MPKPKPPNFPPPRDDEQRRLYEEEMRGRGAGRLKLGAGVEPPRCPFCGKRHAVDKGCGS